MQRHHLEKLDREVAELEANFEETMKNIKTKYQVRACIVGRIQRGDRVPPEFQEKKPGNATPTI